MDKYLLDVKLADEIGVKAVRYTFQTGCGPRCVAGAPLAPPAPTDLAERRASRRLTVVHTGRPAAQTLCFTLRDDGQSYVTSFCVPVASHG